VTISTFRTSRQNDPGFSVPAQEAYTDLDSQIDDCQAKRRLSCKGVQDVSLFGHRPSLGFFYNCLWIFLNYLGRDFF